MGSYLIKYSSTLETRITKRNKKHKNNTKAITIVCGIDLLNNSFNIQD